MAFCLFPPTTEGCAERETELDEINKIREQQKHGEQKK